MNKMNKVELFVKIALFLLLILSFIVFQGRQKHQLNEIYHNAQNIKTELENNIESGIDAVKYLNTSAQLIIDNKERMQLKYAPLVEEYDEKGHYNSDHVFDKNVPNEYKADISGYGGLKKDRATLQEMEMSLYLIRYFKLIKEQNKNFAWVYYYSNKDFVTLYPFSDPKVFVLLPEYKKQPMFQYATPKINPKRELFFTPLYVDNGGLGLMVTLGMPLYDKETFLGITEIDITLASQSTMLKRLDNLGCHSAIINKENEVIALNNIAEPNTKDIIKIDRLIGNKITNLQDTQGEVSLVEGKYVYSQTFANAPWKFIYYEDASVVLLRSLFYTIPLFMIMGFIFYLGKLYSRTHQLSVELKEEVIHSEIQEEELRKKEEEFRTLAENSPDTITRFDLECRRTYVNPSFERIFGCRAADVLGKTPTEISSLPDNILFEEYLKHVIQTGKEFTVDMPFINAAGEKGIGNGQIVPEFGSDGSVISVLAIGRDITERKRAEEALESKSILLQSVLESSPDVTIFALDREYNYIAYNKNHSKVIHAIWGHTIAIGMNMLSSIARDDDKQKAKGLFDKALNGDSFIDETEYGDENLSRSYWQTYYAPMFDHNGTIIGLTCFNLNITERKRAEEHLERTKAKLGAVISTIPDLIWVKDGSGVYMMCNSSFENFFGASCGEILGKTDYDFISREQADFFRQKDREAMKAGEMRINEEEIIFAHNGQHALLETRKIPVYNGDEFMGVLGIGRDITERKHAEKRQEALLETIRKSEEKLSNLFMLSPLGIALTDMNGQYLEFNEAFSKICGYTLDELKELDYWTLTPIEYKEQELQQLETLKRTGRYGPYEKTYRQKNGTLIPIQLNGVLITDENGDEYIWSIVEDITERKIHEEMLHQKESEFRSLTENSPDAIIRYDCEGRSLYINPTAEKLFGLPSNEILGKSLPDSSVLPSDVMFMEKLYTVVQTKTPLEFESEFTTPAGGKRWGHTRILPEFDINGKVASVLVTGRDITEHKKNEDLFNLKQSRLAQMGEMISMIAHQWRQPLGAISTTAGSLELKIDLETFDLETKEGQAEQNLYFKERLKKIRGFVANLTATIDDFRNFYKPNKKSVTTNYESIIIKVMDIMKSSLANDGIELSYNYNSHEEIPMFDSEMMQVILNIFKNAQDNFKEKQIKNPKITVTTFEKTLKICDNGGGIPDAILEKIFDPYFSTKSEKNGTGLGLYMSKTIIEEHHNGTLSALNVDEGICITINLTQEK